MDNLTAYTMSDAMAFITSDEVKTAAMAAGIGAASIAAVSIALALWQPPMNADLSQGLYQRSNFSRIKGGLALATAAVAGKYLYDWKPEVGTAVFASLGGLGLVMMLAPTALFI